MDNYIYKSSNPNIVEVCKQLYPCTCTHKLDSHSIPSMHLNIHILRRIRIDMFFYCRMLLLDFCISSILKYLEICDKLVLLEMRSNSYTRISSMCCIHKGVRVIIAALYVVKGMGFSKKILLFRLMLRKLSQLMRILIQLLS